MNIPQRVTSSVFPFLWRIDSRVVQRSIRREIFLLSLTFFCAAIAIAQTQRDVLYLRDGTIVKGYIVEMIPERTVTIQTSDSTVATYDVSDISQMSKEAFLTNKIAVQRPFAKAGKPYGAQNAEEVLYRPLSVFAGVAVPVGEFHATDSESGGFANTGYTFGVDLAYNLEHEVFWLTTISISYNKLDELSYRKASGLPSSIALDFGSYSTIAPVTGFGVLIPVSQQTSLFFAGQMGVLFGTTPEATASSGSQSINISSGSGSAFAFSISGGLRIGERMTIGMKYLSGQPRYSVSMVGNGISLENEFEQPTSILQIVGGIGL